MKNKITKKIIAIFMLISMILPNIMNIVFLGTPDFALKSLQALYENGNEILAVVTNQDKPKGRGMKLIASPVKEFAIEKNIKVMQPIKVRNNTEFINEIKDLNPDLLCVVAYGKILPKELLDVPKYGSINVHGSLLPKYRGAAPIQWAVLNGDKETGITTMFMDEGMDTGDMIFKEKVTIGEDETTGELWDRLADVGANLLVKTVNRIDEITKEIMQEDKTLSNNDVGQASRKEETKATDNEAMEQSCEEVTESNNEATQKFNKDELIKKLKEKIGAEKQGGDFTLAPMLNKEMAQIDWNKSAQEIKNLVRGLNPIMGAYTFINGKKTKIWKVNVCDDLQEAEGKQNGEIIIADRKRGLFIKTGNGVIEVLEVQGENGKKMDIKSFLNGNQIEVGEILKN